MASRRRLAPLKLSRRPFNHRTDKIIFNINHMDNEQVEQIYRELPPPKVKFIQYKDIGVHQHAKGDIVIYRQIILVESFKFEDGTEVLLDHPNGQLFYKSSGASRTSGLSGYYLPIIKLGFDEFTKKEADYYNGEDLTPLGEAEPMKTSLEKYMRFITIDIARVSKFLLENQIESEGFLIESQYDIDTRIATIPSEIKVATEYEYQGMRKKSTKSKTAKAKSKTAKAKSRSTKSRTRKSKTAKAKSKTAKAKSKTAKAKSKTAKAKSRST